MCGVAGSSIARRWRARSGPPLKRIPQRRKNPARRSKGTRRLNDREQAIDDAPGYVVSRTCTVVDEREPQRDGGGQSPLADYAETAAYVLIAEPGAGKTTALKTEAAKQGAVCVTVRNFLRFDKPEWRDATLFLDGLDESRAGPGDKRRPLDGIVTKLDRLGCPPFRLSCRWGDWLAANDKKVLREVNEGCRHRSIPNLVRIGSWASKGISKFKQELVRPFRISPFKLHHLWIDLRS